MTIKRLKDFTNVLGQIKEKNYSFLPKNFGVYLSLSSLCLPDQLDIIHNWLLTPEVLETAFLVSVVQPPPDKANADYNERFFRITLLDKIHIGLGMVLVPKQKLSWFGLTDNKTASNQILLHSNQTFQGLSELNLTLLYYLFLEATQQSKIKQYCFQLYCSVEQEIIKKISADVWRQVRTHTTSTFSSLQDMETMSSLL